MLLKGKGLGGCGGGGRAASIPLQRGGGGSPLRKGKVLFDMAVAGWVTTAESLPPGGRGWGMSRGAVTGR